MAPITRGTRVPDITLTSTSGTDVDLIELERAIIYFYPKDMTPGCTVEACSFSDANDRIEAAGWSVYGVSTDTLSRHERFIEKYGLRFELLSDPDHEAVEAFGVRTEKSMLGKRSFGTARVTFAIEDGMIAHVWEKIDVKRHANDVLEWIQSRPSRP